MPSERKIAANRSNAKKSTGPRSNAGRQASRRNALRHGLAIDIRTDPAYSDDIEQLAQLMSHARGRQNVSDNARDAAEATLDLDRIRKVRAFLFETIYLPDRAALDCLCGAERQALQTGTIRASCIFEAQARPARYVERTCAFKCSGCQSDMIVVQPRHRSPKGRI